MDETRYNVVFRGELEPGHQVEEVKKRFASLLKKELTAIEQKYFTGSSVIIKSGLDQQKALKLSSQLTSRTGALFEVETGKKPPPQESSSKASDSFPPGKTVEPRIDEDQHAVFTAITTELSQIKIDTHTLLSRVDRLQQQFVHFGSLLSGSVTGAGSSQGVSEKQALDSEPVFDFDDIEPPAPLEKEKTPPTEQPAKKIPHITFQPQQPKKTPPPLPKRMSSPQKTRQEKQESEILFGQKWLLIAGVITTILAVGWFLKYSFDQNWIGPAGRVMMAYLGGLVFLAVGDGFRRREFDMFGLYLIGGGIGILYFSTYAAFQIYHLFPQILAFGVMIFVTALAGILALLYDTKWLAVLGLIGGFFTPIILSTGHDNQIALMTYMTILNTGILSIAFFKQWRLLNYLGFFCTYLLFTTWYARYYEIQKFWPTTMFLNIFFLMYAFVPFVYHFLKAHKQHLLGIGLIVPNSFIAFAYSFAMIKTYFHTETVSVVTLLYAAIFFGMAWYMYQRDREQVSAFIMLLANAIFFLVLTVPILFSKHWITVFWTIQAVVLFWAALKLKNTWLYTSSIILGVLGLGKFFLYDYTQIFRLLTAIYFRGGYTFLLVERWITSLIVLAALFQAARMTTKTQAKTTLFQRQQVLPVIWGAFVIALFLILNVEVSGFFHSYAPQARFASISVLWTLFSIVVMMFGFVKNQSILRISAIGLFAVTMLKVFLLDMANVSTPYRVISFLVLGLMLIGASYLYHRFKDKILPSDLKEEDT